MCTLEIHENVATIAQMAVSQPKLSKRPYSMQMPLQNLQIELPRYTVEWPGNVFYSPWSMSSIRLSRGSVILLVVG